MRASGARAGVDESVTLIDGDYGSQSLTRLRTHGGEGELLFRFAHQYTIVEHPDDPATPGDLRRGPFKVRSMRYRYDILDRDKNEIIVFHWDPNPQNIVTEPHVHLAIARPVTLAQRENSAVATRELHLNKLHIPTKRIFVEDVVRFLIREFAVVPLRDDWSEVIRENLRAIERGRTW